MACKPAWRQVCQASDCVPRTRAHISLSLSFLLWIYTGELYALQYALDSYLTRHCYLGCRSGSAHPTPASKVLSKLNGASFELHSASSSRRRPASVSARWQHYQGRPAARQASPARSPPKTFPAPTWAARKTATARSKTARSTHRFWTLAPIIVAACFRPISLRWVVKCLSVLLSLGVLPKFKSTFKSSMQTKGGLAPLAAELGSHSGALPQL